MCIDVQTRYMIKGLKNIQDECSMSLKLTETSKQINNKYAPIFLNINMCLFIKLFTYLEKLIEISGVQVKQFMNPIKYANIQIEVNEKFKKHQKNKLQNIKKSNLQ